MGLYLVIPLDIALPYKIAPVYTHYIYFCLFYVHRVFSFTHSTTTTTTTTNFCRKCAAKFTIEFFTQLKAQIKNKYQYDVRYISCQRASGELKGGETCPYRCSHPWKTVREGNLKCVIDKSGNHLLEHDLAECILPCENLDNTGEHSSKSCKCNVDDTCLKSSCVLNQDTGSHECKNEEGRAGFRDWRAELCNLDYERGEDTWTIFSSVKHIGDCLSHCKHTQFTGCQYYGNEKSCYAADLKDENTFLPDEGNYFCAKRTECFDRNLDYHGGDILIVPSFETNAYLCQERCQKNEECRFFTFQTIEGGGHCFLKNAKNSPPRDCPTCTSGPKLCPGTTTTTTATTL